MLSTLPKFARYLITGGLGFLTDAAVMELLVWLGMPPQGARLISIPVAMVLTYLLHTHYTFAGDGRRHDPRELRLLGGFIVCQAIAAALNYLTFYLALEYVPIPQDFLRRMFALCAGTGVGLVANFLLLNTLVYGRGRPEKPGA